MLDQLDHWRQGRHQALHVKDISRTAPGKKHEQGQLEREESGDSEIRITERQGEENYRCFLEKHFTQAGGEENSSQGGEGKHQ